MGEGRAELLASDRITGDALVDDRPSLALLLAQAERTLRRRVEPTLRAAGLAFDHWRIMSVLLAHPGSGMSAVADQADLPSATLTRHMDLLVQRAVVVRRIDPADRRRVVAALSPSGEALARRIREHERAAEAEIAGTLDSLRSARFPELGLVPSVPG